MQRRKFFHFSSAALISAGLGSCSKPVGAEVRVAFIGVKGRGGQLIKDGILKHKAARIVALCDVDQRELDKRSAELEKQGLKVATYTDYRTLLLSKDIDAVFVATPNHTHTLIAMTAIAAGKHVYVEKPVCHNLWEGKMLVEAAAKKPNLIVQHGMQRRSNTGWQSIMKYLAEGKLGKVNLSRGVNYKVRTSIGKVTEGQKIPKAVNADLWFGPRTPKPVMRDQFHYDWHWFWEYGNGDIGNQGPHQFDVARWALGDPKLPQNILSLGNRWGYDDNGETPNQQLAFFSDAAGKILFDNRGLPIKSGAKEQPKFQGKFEVGNAIHCENGWIGEKFAYDNAGKEIEKFTFNDDTTDHVANFIASVQAGKAVSPHLLVEVGFHAAAMAHLANISYRVGQATGADLVKEKLKDDATALATFTDFQANLEANQVDLAAKPTVLGAPLTFDPVTQNFTGAFAAEANALLKEEYREEFKLPAV